MTNDVIEILRHHENPRQVLARGIPRFKPFDVMAALSYARSHFGKDAMFLEPCIYAAFCNAHSSELVWLLTSVGEPNPYHYAARYWGPPKPARQYASARFYQQDGHWWTLVSSDATSPGLAEVEFIYKRTNYSHRSDFPKLETFECLLVETILDEWRRLGSFASLEQKRHNIKVSIPLSQLGDVIARYESLFLGDDMLKFEEGESCAPGQLLEQQARKHHITPEELASWLGPPPDDESQGYQSYQEDITPTFAIHPEQAVLPFESREDRGDFDHSDIPF